jgi:hypothetical protein
MKNDSNLQKKVDTWSTPYQNKNVETQPRNKFTSFFWFINRQL